MSMANQPVKILIIDDDEDDFLITDSYIKHIPGSISYATEWCEDYKAAMQKLEQNVHDIYIVDYKLGAHTGLELLRFALEKGNDAPKIFFTGKGNTDIDKEAMALGASDYLIKSELSVDKLERSLRYTLERRANQHALKETEKKFRAIFEHSNDTIFLLDETMCFADINHAGQLLLERERENIIGKHFIEFIADEDQQRHISNALHDALDLKDYNLNILTPDGTAKPCILTINAGDTQNAAFQINGILHDNTQRKREELKTLQNEKLSSTFRLVNLLAHEVRNPLNNIMLAIDAIGNEDSLTDDDRMYKEMVQRNSQRISRLIDELLNASRPGKVKTEKLSLNEVLREVATMAQDRLTLKKTLLQLNLPDEEIIVEGEKEKLTIGILNIVINGIEAVEEDKGIINMSLFGQRDKAVVSIIDNGCGMDEEHLSKIFEPYFTSKHNGMGIGLAATYNIMKSHEVEMDVRSMKGEGTTFILHFKQENAANN